MAVALSASSLWAQGDDEVIVTRQLTTGQRNALPEKTITVEMKRLSWSKKATPGLIEAIEQVMDTIVKEDYQHRTFALLVEPKEGDVVAIAAHSDDILTRGSKDASIYYGDMERGRYHFVVLLSKGNQKLLEQIGKRHGKVKFVQEFEFVDFRTPNYPTSVIAQWSPGGGLRWQSVVINENPDMERAD